MPHRFRPINVYKPKSLDFEKNRSRICLQTYEMRPVKETKISVRDELTMMIVQNWAKAWVFVGI